MQENPRASWDLVGEFNPCASGHSRRAEVSRRVRTPVASTAREGTQGTTLRSAAVRSSSARRWRMRDARGVQSDDRSSTARWPLSAPWGSQHRAANECQPRGDRGVEPTKGSLNSVESNGGAVNPGLFPRDMPRALRRAITELELGPRLVMAKKRPKGQRLRCGSRRRDGAECMGPVVYGRRPLQAARRPEHRAPDRCWQSGDRRVESTSRGC